MAWVVSLWPFTADARVQSQASPWEVDRVTVGEVWLQLIWFVLSVSFHAFIHASPTLYNLSNWHTLWVWRQYVTTYQLTLCHNPEDHRMRQLPTCSDSAPRWSMFQTPWDPHNDYTGTRRTWSLRGGGACSRFPTAGPCNRWTGAGLWGLAPLREWLDLRQTWSSWRSSGDSCVPA